MKAAITYCLQASEPITMSYRIHSNLPTNELPDPIMLL